LRGIWGKVWSCDERMDHLKTAISRDPSHNQLANADTIAYTSTLIFTTDYLFILLPDRTMTIGITIVK
jgi:hypothetical protein